MERKLVSLRNVDGISPVTFLNADNELKEANAIEVAHFGGWNVIVKKNQFEIDQLAVFVEIDTILPVEIPLFTFLKGKRIRTKKLKGVVSQGVAFTIPEILNVMSDVLDSKDEYNSVLATFMKKEWEIGEDLTEYVGATKYDEYSNNGRKGDGIKLPPANARGAFPTFIHKTDEERIQNLAKELKYDWRGKEVVITEKLDGSSITIYAHWEYDEEQEEPLLISGICSRNLDLKLESTESHFIKTGWSYMLKLTEFCTPNMRSLALQGEIIGPGIQGNPYKLTEHKIYFFNVFDIDAGRKVEPYSALDIMNQLDVSSVPVMQRAAIKDWSMEDVLEIADGASVLNSKANREGIVVRALDGSFSFKVISNKWLLKEKD